MRDVTFALDMDGRRADIVGSSGTRSRPADNGTLGGSNQATHRIVSAQDLASSSNACTGSRSRLSGGCGGAGSTDHALRLTGATRITPPNHEPLTHREGVSHAHKQK
jgi:hypothetical protein